MYSKNNGWYIRLVQNEVGYRLVVIYSSDPIPDLFQEEAYVAFAKLYYSDTPCYATHNLYEKQLTQWETSYLIHLLEEECFYALLAPNMKLSKEKHVGYTGECQIKDQGKV